MLYKMKMKIDIEKVCIAIISFIFNFMNDIHRIIIKKYIKPELRLVHKYITHCTILI